MTARRIKRSKSWLLLKLGLLLYLVVGLFVLVWLRAKIVNMEYELAELNAEKLALLKEERYLLAERASLYSAKRVEDIATKRLGMDLPDRENIFYVKRTRQAGAYVASMPLSESTRREDLLWR
jgi:cell division protein FtsL